MLKRCIALLALLSPTFVLADDIVIGLDADMSAVAVEGGVAIQRGALIAIEEINASGGVLGKQLRLEVKDHRGNPARGVDNIVDFASNPQVVAVLGGVHTPVALHELPVIHEHKIIYLGAWAAGTGIVENKYKPNYVFRASVNDKWAAKVIVPFAQRRQIKKVALFLERTGWGRSNEKSMTYEAKKRGIQIDHVHWFNWGETNFDEAWKKANKQQVDAVLLVANAPEGAKIMRSLIETLPNQRIPVLSHWGIASGSFVQRLGIEQLSQVDLHVLQSFSFVNASDLAKKHYVLEQYQYAFDKNASAKSINAQAGVAQAYDLVHLLAKAIEQAGTTDRASVRDAMEKLENVRGLIKLYTKPFTAERHDALVANDYFMARFNKHGQLEPIQ